MFWAVAVAIGALIVARTASQYTTARRRLASLRVTLDDDAIATATSSDALTVPRERIARIVEMRGALGGLRVESQPDPRSGVVIVASVPRGGDGLRRRPRGARALAADRAPSAGWASASA